MANYIDFICSIISVLFIGIQKGKKEAHYSIGFTCFLFIVGRDGSGVQSWPHFQMPAVQGESLASKIMF